MGAGTQRWWRDDRYARECGEWTASLGREATHALVDAQDGIETTVRSWTPVRRAPARFRVRIGDDIYEFPEGTTREEAQSVLDEAKVRYLRQILIGQLCQLAGPRR